MVRFLGKVPRRLYRYPVDEKFCSISHCFRGKCVFALYAENQYGRQKWQENDFGENSPVDPADTLWVKNSSKSLFLTPFLRY